MTLELQFNISGRACPVLQKGWNLRCGALWQVGGEKEAAAAAGPILALMGHKQVYCGAYGSGQAAKVGLLPGLWVSEVKIRNFPCARLLLEADGLYYFPYCSSQGLGR